MSDLRPVFKSIWDEAEIMLPSKGDLVLLSFVSILARGHILIEDVPGMGKTTLVRFLAKLCGLELKRVQFTNDILPADILGVSIFHPETSSFVFRKGPLFSELVLADELNRAPPKTQSALLQAMEEREITVEGVTHKLSPLFTVMATQNPRGMSGTFALPESQLDRFLMKFPVGLPTVAAEKTLMKAPPRSELLLETKSRFTSGDLLGMQAEVQNVKTSESLLDYVLRLLQQSRHDSGLRGLSPRTGLDIVKASKAYAWIHSRDYVTPDDVKHVFPYVVGHRLPLQELGCLEEHRMANEILAKVAVV